MPQELCILRKRREGLNSSTKCNILATDKIPLIKSLNVNGYGTLLVFNFPSQKGGREGQFLKERICSSRCTYFPLRVDSFSKLPDPEKQTGIHTS